MARFVIEYRYPESPRREVYVTNEPYASLNGAPLRDGGEIIWRGHRWHVALEADGDELWVFTPVAA
jgi:hypothetical protein